MKLWIDDLRPAPDGYVWCKTVNEAKTLIECTRSLCCDHHSIIELIDIDHDAGEFSQFGGDYIKLLDWLEDQQYHYPIHIHSMNPVGVENMRRIIRRNHWVEL